MADLVVKTKASEKEVIFFFCVSREPDAGGQVQHLLYFPHTFASQALSSSGEKFKAAVGRTEYSKARPPSAFTNASFMA